MHKGHVIIVCALPAESRPWITLFKLQRQHGEQAFTRYCNASNTISLIESGMGVLAAATATASAFYLSGSQQHTVFCNIGIAGGRHPIGSVYEANKITHAETGQSEYPLPRFDLPSENLITLNKPSSHFTGNSLHDMEAFGFYKSASRLVEHEQICVIKCVSDSDKDNIKHVNAQFVTQLLEKQSETIEQCIEKCTLLSNTEAKIHSNHLPLYESCLQQAHFTEYQKQQLKKNCRQVHALDSSIESAQWENCNDAKQLLHNQSKLIEQLI